VRLLAGELLISIGLTCDANRRRRVPKAPDLPARTPAAAAPISSGIGYR
jgi:hypothetical protein